MANTNGAVCGLKCSQCSVASLVCVLGNRGGSWQGEANGGQPEGKGHHKPGLPPVCVLVAAKTGDARALPRNIVCGAHRRVSPGLCYEFCPGRRGGGIASEYGRHSTLVLDIARRPIELGATALSW